MEFIDAKTFESTKALFTNGEEFKSLAVQLVDKITEAQVSFVTLRDKGNVGELRNLAHSLKSPTKLFGLHVLSEHCLKIEQSGNENKLPEVRDIELFKEKSDIAIHFLKRELDIA
ncbi:MAG: Hpt domain-containing protein [Luteibaculaceae bacterium]